MNKEEPSAHSPRESPSEQVDLEGSGDVGSETQVNGPDRDASSRRVSSGQP